MMRHALAMESFAWPLYTVAESWWLCPFGPTIGSRASKVSHQLPLKSYRLLWQS